MIRKMQESDLAKLIKLCEKHFYAVDMGGRFHSYDRKTSKRTLSGFLSNQNIITLINEENGKINGIIAFMVTESIFDSTHIKASEILWYSTSKKTFLNLFNEMLQLLKPMVRTIHIGVNYSNNVGKWLQKKGFTPTEQIYGMEAVYV